MIDFLKKAFSEDSGKPSHTRILLGLIVACHLTWQSYIVYRTGIIPPWHDSCIVLIALLIGGVGVGKLPNILNALVNKAEEKPKRAPARPKRSKA